MSLTKNQIIIVIVVLALFLIAALVLFGILPGLRSSAEKDLLRGELTIWGVDSANLVGASLIANYQSTYPEVKVNYRSFNESNYESQLINALASGRGPDIFMVHRSWLSKHKDKLSSLSEQQYPRAGLLNDFPQVVASDFNDGLATYAIPLYLDTLALFYNRDLFNNAGVIGPPETWEELKEIIPKLNEITETGRIERSAIALGGSEKSMPHVSDILSLIMLQDEVKFTSSSGIKKYSFAAQGEASLKDYLSYSNPASTNYSWQDDMRNASELFASENLAVLIGYVSDEDTLKARNPFLNFSLAPMLQREDAAKAVNYADYWGLGVAKTSPNQSLAWNFIGNTTLNTNIMRQYSLLSKRPPALLQLLVENSANPAREFITRQTLTAQSWPQPDENLSAEAFSEAIISILNLQSSPQAALRKVEEQMNGLVKN